MGEKTGLVLVLDQDWRIRKLIRANLEALGLRVHEAIDSEHAIAHVREQRTNLVLLERESLDVELLQFLRSLGAQAYDQQPAIIVMSAEPPDRGLLNHMQVAGCLQKPFSASSLLSQVERVLLSSPAEAPAP